MISNRSLRPNNELVMSVVGAAKAPVVDVEWRIRRGGKVAGADHGEGGVERTGIQGLGPGVGEVEGDALREAAGHLRFQCVVGGEVVGVEHVEAAELRVRYEDEGLSGGELGHRDAALQTRGDGRGQGAHGVQGLGLRSAICLPPNTPDNNILVPNQAMVAGGAPSNTVQWVPGKLDRINDFVVASTILPNLPGAAFAAINTDPRTREVVPWPNAVAQAHTKNAREMEPLLPIGGSITDA